MSRKSFLLRIDQKLFEEIEAWAQQEMRSVNGQIEYILRQASGRYKGKDLTLELRGDSQEIGSEAAENPDSA